MSAGTRLCSLRQADWAQGRLLHGRQWLTMPKMQKGLQHVARHAKRGEGVQMDTEKRFLCCPQGCVQPRMVLDRRI